MLRIDDLVVADKTPEIEDDSLDMKDLATNHLQNHADENVGNITPHKEGANLSASENLSLS